MNLTKEQIKEVLERLRYYCWWMYFHKEANKVLKAVKRKYRDKEFTLNVLDNGFLEVKILNTDLVGVYNVFSKTISPKYGILNIDYDYKLVNEEEIKLEDREMFYNIGKSFVLSFVQRIHCFTFYARMHDETIDGISNDLLLMSKD